MKTAIQLSDHFTYNKLLRFTFPSIVMMVFTSIYGVVDGFFVSNFAGKTAFASLNLIFPFVMILDAAAHPGETGAKAHPAGMRQRFLGADEQYLRLHCQHDL